jgi:trk system potassium uptake protein TrkA
VAAVTSNDSANLVICYLAKTQFEVPRTIARVNNPNNAWLFNEKFLVDVALNSADVFAHLIQEEMSLGDMMTLFKIRRGRYSVVEEKVPAGAKVIGVQLKDMGLAEHCVIAAIIRDGVMTLPRGDSTLQAEDEIIAVASAEGAQMLADLLSFPVYPTRNGAKKE